MRKKWVGLNSLERIGIVVLFCLIPVQASAEEVSTSGSLRLLTNDEITEPHDPENPSRPLYPDKPEDSGGSRTNNKGPLSLDVIPTKFDFGKQKMYTKMHTYQAVNKDEVTSNGQDVTAQYIQVTDNRDAGIYGWEVKAKQDRYLTNKSGYALNGATINIPVGVARNSLNNPPTKKDDSFITNAVEITTSDKTIWSSPIDTQSGKSTSTYSWDASDVSLTIPADTVKKGTYSNTVIWTIVANVSK